MTDERSQSEATPTPDSRAEYDNSRRDARREDEADEIAKSPAPYDVARLDTHPDKIIVKGEREKPGPTDDDDTQPARTGGDDTGDLGGNDLHRRINNELDAYEDEDQVREAAEAIEEGDAPDGAA